MLENMALPESEDKLVTSKSFHMQFARFISTVFSPAIITLPFILLVALYTHEANALLAAGIIIFFLSVGPMGYVLYGVKTGKFSDVDVSIRSQRTGPARSVPYGCCCPSGRRTVPPASWCDARDCDWAYQSAGEWSASDPLPTDGPPRAFSRTDRARVASDSPGVP